MTPEKLSKIANLLAQAKKSVNTDGTPTDYPSLMDKILRLEFKEGLESLQKLPLSEDFADAFKKLCALREKDSEYSIPFSEGPYSQINKLYWEIAELVFEPQTMQEMLNIIMPSVTKFLVASLPDTLPHPMTSKQLIEFKNNMAPALTLNKNLNGLNQPPKIDDLSHYVFSNDLIFDVNDIENYSRNLHIKTRNQLQDQYPELSKKIYTHNAQLQNLYTDLQPQKNIIISPYQALTQLYDAHLKGGSEVTGTSYATEEAAEATKKFLAYFYQLPLTVQDNIKALSYDYNNASTFGSFLTANIERGTCVHGTASTLKMFLDKHKYNPLLIYPPNMNNQDLNQLQAKNNRAPLNTQMNADHSIKLPTELTQQAILQLKLTKTGIITLLISAPAELYDLLFDYFLTLDPSQIGLEQNHSPILQELLAVTKENFTPEQSKFLAKTINKHYKRFNYNQSLLDWALQSQNQYCILEALEQIDINKRVSALIERRATSYFPNFLAAIESNTDTLKSFLLLLPENKRLEAIKSLTYQNNNLAHAHRIANQPEALKTLFSLIPENQRLELAQTTDLSGISLIRKIINNTESLKTLLSLLPKNHKLEAVKTELHTSANNPEAIKALLPLWPDDQRLEAVKRLNNNGDNVVHLAVTNPEALKALLSLLPADQRLDAIKEVNKMGNSAAHLAVTNIESLRVLLSLLPENQRATALKLVNDAGQRVLQLIATNPGALLTTIFLIPESQRFETIRTIHQDGVSVLHLVISNIECLKALIALYPANQRLTAMQALNKNGDNLLHALANNPEALTAVLSLLPDDQKADAVCEVNHFGDSLLHKATSNHETLKALMALIPASQLLDRVKVVNKNGENVLFKAAANFESLALLLQLWPQEQRLEALKLTNNFGDGPLNQLTLTPDMLKKLVPLMPEDQRLETIKSFNLSLDTIFSLIANDFEALHMIVSLWPIDQRLDVIKQVNKNGETILHLAINNLEALEFLVSLWPEEQRLEAYRICNNFGESVLHKALKNPASLKTLISLIPESQRQTATQIVDKDGVNILHKAIAFPESLNTLVSLLTESQKTEFRNSVQTNSENILFAAILYPESLKILLSVLPENQRLAAVTRCNSSGTNVIHRLANSPQTLEMVLKLLPEHQRFEALKTFNSEGYSAIHIMAKGLVGLNTLLAFLPANQRWDAVTLPDNTSNHLSAVHYYLASNNYYGGNYVAMLNCLPPEQQEWLNQLRNFKANHALFQSIQAMRNDISQKYYSFYTPDQQQDITNLANALESKAISFFLNSVKKPPTEEELIEFKYEYKELLHSQDELMQRHQEAWAVITGNILLGLITGGIGFIALAIKASINAIDAYRFNRKVTLNDSLFFAHTNREVNISTIDKSIDSFVDKEAAFIPVPSY